MIVIFMEIILKITIVIFFTGFLEYSGLALLNRIYALGEPTYEILKERRSIIDYGLTNSKSIVRNFEILPIHVGATPQTCHNFSFFKLP